MPLGMVQQGLDGATWQKVVALDLGGEYMALHPGAADCAFELLTRMLREEPILICPQFYFLQVTISTVCVYTSRKQI